MNAKDQILQEYQAHCRSYHNPQTSRTETFARETGRREREEKEVAEDANGIAVYKFEQERKKWSEYLDSEE